LKLSKATPIGRGEGKQINQLKKVDIFQPTGRGGKEEIGAKALFLEGVGRVTCKGGKIAALQIEKMKKALSGRASKQKGS